MKNRPTKTPANRPTRPAIAVISPPPRRKNALHGQPKKIRQPIIANTPKKNLENAALPDTGVKFLLQSILARKPPMIRPKISGLRYCTTLAW